MVLRHRLGWDANFMARDAWFWPLARAAGALAATEDWPSHAMLDAMYARTVRSGDAVSLRFAPMQPRAKGEELLAERLYDGRIAVEHVVPTRGDNWHDLLNALCFATWPKSKFGLHARQHRAQRARLGPGVDRLPPVRTREQDALTLFDEGGMVVAALPAAARVLAATPVQGFEDALQALCERAEVVLVPFGHALFEHLVEGVPCPGATARLVELPAFASDANEMLTALDDALSSQLADEQRFRAPTEGVHVRLQRFQPDMKWVAHTRLPS